MFNSAFSKGKPRAGQWCLLDDKNLGIFVQMDHGQFKTVGDVITYSPPIRPGQITTGGNPSFGQVDLVDETGFGVKAHLLVDIKRLKPLLDKKLIPLPRLKTCDPKWEPRP